MQARRSVLVFTILLSLACLYQISFSYFTGKVEQKAAAKAVKQLDSIKRGSGMYFNGNDTLYTKDPVDLENIQNLLEENNVRKVTYKQAYPIIGKTYAECKANEMAWGLDLKGGMAVTLEISYPSLIENLSGKSKNPTFVKPYEASMKEMKSSTEDFITIFERNFNKLSPNASMAKIFAVGDNARFKTTMTNDEVIAKLREEAKSALDRTENIISNRINKFGVTEPSIQKQPLTGRLLIELPGVKDKLRVRKLLQSTANLEFWETYDTRDILETYLPKADEFLAKVLNGEEGNDVKEKEEKKDSDTLVDENDSLKNIENKLASDTSNKTSDTLSATENLLTNANDKNDTAKKKDESKLSAAEQAKLHPIYSILGINGFSFFEDPKRKGYGNYADGCRVGVVRLADTSKMSGFLKNPALSSIWPPDLKLMWGAKTEIIQEQETDLLALYAIKVTSRDGNSALEGKYVTDAFQDYDPMDPSKVVVNMRMDNEGAEKWRILTGNNKPSNGRKHAIAIVLDNVVYSAPTVEGEISGGSSVIQGNFTIDEATDLANILKAGSLPARAQIVDEAIVGPTLGASNISSGFISFFASFILILLYMIIFYNRAGIVANIALITNVFFLIGALASVQATLTLPGIAGIVLTMGMAVDGNVLIYERIKELLREGKSLKLAIDEGFKGSYATILDANITNLLIAIVLAVFGVGPIRGFAVTLIIGIFTSVFSSIFITRLVVTWFLERKKSLNFSFKWSEKFLSSTTYDFVKRRKLYYLISAIFIIVGFTSLYVRSLDYGVEFTGGRSFEVRFDKPANYDGIRKELAHQFVQDGKELSPEVKMIENKFKAKITTKFLINDNNDTIVDAKVENALRKGLDKFGVYRIEASRKIDPVISAAFIRSAILSVVLSVIIMFLYIMLRFQKWQYGLGTAVALFHDVLFVLGLYSLLHGVMPFSMEVDQAFIAAVLTIMGYSINDTVVVFDRIREYLRMGRKESQDVLINEALNSTLSRTVNNSITIAVVLFAIFFFGPESIKGFIFALMIGVVVGTYSSVCIATPILVDFAGKKKDDAKK